ncbi:MAG TPA: pectate lyase [Prevotella sp.]|nr:pectate lyase [Prevotella sp.]
MSKRLSLLIMFIWIAHVYVQSFSFDYSYVGYKMSEAPVPDVPVSVFVPCNGGDQSVEIQHAVDFVSSLRPDRKSGLRGAVLLGKGTFLISSPIRIAASGVVLRGSGHKATILQKAGVERGAIVYIEGRNDRQIKDTLKMNTHLVYSARGNNDVLILRHSTAEWINKMRCANFGGGQDLGYWGWHPGEMDLEFTRTITPEKKFDAPLPVLLDKDCQIMHYVWPGRIHDSGVENLILESTYNVKYPKDEDHAWDGVYIANAKDCWVRIVDFRNLSGSAVIIQRSGSQITVQDCRSFTPVGEIGGYRRRTFLTFGEKCLFQRLYSENGINDFATGFLAAGPNVFSQCDSHESLGFSGSIGSFASGVLFDDVNIDGNAIKFCNLGIEKYGTGWNATNSTVYQSTASAIYADSLPDGSNNYVYGCWGQFCGTGNYDESNNHVQPWSLFGAQLQKRLGRDVSGVTRTLSRNVEASSNPTLDLAQRMVAEAHHSRVTMKEWADSAMLKSYDYCGRHYRSIASIKYKRSLNQDSALLPHYAIVNGKLTIDEALAVGGKHNAPWWNGRVKYSTMQKLPEAITRTVPGMEFQGATDRIDTVISHFEKNHVLMLSQNYGLWYDRRRDDHERIRRQDGDVWGPFYEQPFARSGQGKAWDGLSKYDLTRLNPYYFYRLNEFAGKAAPKGILLFNEMYFQHNILEAGAHWVDCPWRSANNINHTGFPEPVPFTGDKRIFMADRFYDETDSVRGKLHKQFIMNELDALSNHPNVIQSIGEEFTGPFHFVKFWLQTIKEWEQKTGKNVLVALSVNKDVQDSVLRDPVLNKIVNIVDIEQWYYHSKGLFAPPGGMNLAPRQYERSVRTGRITFRNVYQSVSEYREAYPDKAVIYYAKAYSQEAWAVLMAGGSCPEIPVRDITFLKDAASMLITNHQNGVYLLRNTKGDALIYTDEGSKSAKFDIPAGLYRLSKVNDKTGTIEFDKKITVKSGFEVKDKGVFWLQKIK